jgi:hypothetical protein
MPTDPTTAGDGLTDDERAALGAALATVPSRHSAVGVSVHGDLAWTCTTPTRAKDPGDDWDIYEGWVDIGLVRVDGEWQVWHHSSGGWLTWWSPDGYEEGAVGVLALVDDAPAGARAAEIRFQGRTYVAPVRHGAYFFAVWDQPSQDDPLSAEEFKELFRNVGGDHQVVEFAEWIDAPSEPEALPWRSPESDDMTTPVLVRFLD